LSSKKIGNSKFDLLNNGIGHGRYLDCSVGGRCKDGSLIVCKLDSKKIENNGSDEYKGIALPTHPYHIVDQSP